MFYELLSCVFGVWISVIFPKFLSECERLLALRSNRLQEYKELISEVHTVKSNCNSEIKRREALEISCSSLKQGSGTPVSSLSNANVYFLCIE